MSEYDFPSPNGAPTLESLEMEFRTLMNATAEIVRMAMTTGPKCDACGHAPYADKDAALAGMKRLESLIEKIGKMRGIIRTNVMVQHSLVESTEWAQLRSTILRALQPHPLALADVRAAMGKAGENRPPAGWRPPEPEPRPAFLLGAGPPPKRKPGRPPKPRATR